MRRKERISWEIPARVPAALLLPRPPLFSHISPSAPRLASSLAPPGQLWPSTTSFADWLSLGHRCFCCWAGWNQLSRAQGRPWPLLTGTTLPLLSAPRYKRPGVFTYLCN